MPLLEAVLAENKYDVDALVYKGLALKLSGKSDAAILLYNQALNIDARNVNAYI